MGPAVETDSDVGLDSVIVARLHDAFKKANEMPSMVSLYGKFDIIPRYATRDDFRKPA